MPVYIDQTGKEILLDKIPQRIVSLVPSQTELLSDLGLDKEVAGITKFCVHPEKWFRHKTRIGGTKQVKIDIIQQLNPDLIIANKEENVKEQVEELSAHYPVWTSNINDIDSACGMICQLGLITGRKEKAAEISGEIKKRFALLPSFPSRIRSAYLIWKKPYMTAGGDTFIHAMMQAAGFENIFAQKSRYPAISLQELHDGGCQLLLLSSEPFPFRQKHIDELQPLLPAVKILLVDGEMFSWYGSRLLKAPAYFRELRQELDVPGTFS